MLPTTITSEQLRQLTGYSKAQLVELEQSGLIWRDAKNTWPIEAVTRIVARLRERGRRPANDEHSRFEKARADRERLKLMKEVREVCYVREFAEFVDAVYAAHVKHYGPVASRIGGRDLALRRLAEQELAVAQQGLSDEMKRLGDALAEGDKAS
jgi:hypothetical protein